MSKYCLPAIGAAAMMLIAAPAFAQDTATHNRQNELVKGQTVTIEGCVVQGQKKNTFVIGSLLEIPAAPIETGRKRIYWMSPKELKSHVGERVQVTGRIYDLERSEIEVDRNGGSGAVAKIEGPGGADVSVAAEVVGVPAVIGALTGTVRPNQGMDVLITLVKIKVDNVKTVSGTCP